MVASIQSAVKIRVYIDLDSVGGGQGPSGLGAGFSNNPAFGSAGNAGIAGGSQTLRLQVGEMVLGAGGSITEAQILTALQLVASDFAAASGTPLITAAILAQINAWNSGSP